MSSFVSGIDHFIAGAPASFTLKEVIAALTKDLKFAYGEKQRAESAITAILQDDPRVFCNIKTGQCILRCEFYRNAQLLVTPTAWELAQGILLPGHRFAPFCFTDVFPSEITILDGRSKLKSREVIMGVEDVSSYYALLGAESMYDFLVAEHPQNQAKLRNGSKTGDTPVIVIAFECNDYYQKHQVKPGDSLLLAVTDWEKGCFKLSGVVAAKKNAQDASTDWCRKLDGALAEIIGDYDFYLEIPEQFGRAFFLLGAEMLQKPSCSLDEYMRHTDRVEIGYMSGDTALVLKDDAPEENLEWGKPDDISVSQGEVGSLEQILHDSGCILQLSEIEALMLDHFQRQETDFETFYQRCFGTERLNFADEAQEAYFMTYLEDMWETRQTTYDRFGDSDKAPLRTRLLELIQERRDWLRYVNDLEINLESLHQDPVFMQFAAASVHLTALCRLLNSEQNVVSSSEAEALNDKIEQMAELQTGFLEKLNAVIGGMN